MTQPNSVLAEWHALEQHAQEMSTAHLRDYAATDTERWKNFHFEYGDFMLDVSRQRVTKKTLSLLFDLARATHLDAHIKAMFGGELINTTERRAALHTALRSPFAGGPSIQAEVSDLRAKLAVFVGAVRSGAKLGLTGKKFKHVINIGIGGSDLGPLLVCDALHHEWSGGITPHFVSNVDRTQLEDLMRVLDPAETLVIVCSKTFITQETQSNANAARAWIVGALGEKSPGHHFVAVSTNSKAMDAFGIAAEHRFTMWDWVGGRYSVWSAIGLVAELTIGTDKFVEFLQGGSEIDKHFIDTPFESNLPVIMGVIGAWNRTFLHLPTLAVLPYDQRLARLPAYLQQLEMESNGKSVSLEGQPVTFATAPVVWGEPGSNAQHSFFQMLHQGTPTVAMDFIAPLFGSWGGTEAQDLALQNCFAQTQALSYGHTAGEVEVEMRAAGSSAKEVERLESARVYEGNRPNSLLMYPRTTARTLGALIALYEHSVFVQGTLWGINSFDQFGVELGKKLAHGIDMTGGKSPSGHGADGVAALIEYVKSHR